MIQRGQTYKPLFQGVSVDQIRLVLEAEKLLPSPCRQLLVEFSREDTEKVERIVRDELKSKEADEHVLKLVKAILTSMFKQLYTRRATWKDGLSLQQD